MNVKAEPDWVRCGRCGLGHSVRPDRRCPRCRTAVDLRPSVSDGPRPGPMPRLDAVSAPAADPALRPTTGVPPPAQLRVPARLASVSAVIVAVSAELSDAPFVFTGLAVGLGLGALVIALLARA